jgi:DNA polymerase-3 subunit epsilon
VLTLFARNVLDVPMVWLDTETTGTDPGTDGVVQLGIARFEPGKEPTVRTWLVNPGREIPEEAIAIHGITNAMVEDARSLFSVLISTEFRDLTEGALPGAYNAAFDRAFLSASHGLSAKPAILANDWPWLDSLTLVRLVDRYVRGKGRHKLAAACQRHGVDLGTAHDAGADARAAGLLFCALLTHPDLKRVPRTVGDLLLWLEIERAREWHRFTEWLSRQPLLPPENAP